MKSRAWEWIKEIVNWSDVKLLGKHESFRRKLPVEIESELHFEAANIKEALEAINSKHREILFGIYSIISRFKRQLIALWHIKFRKQQQCWNLIGINRWYSLFATILSCLISGIVEYINQITMMWRTLTCYGNLDFHDIEIFLKVKFVNSSRTGISSRLNLIRDHLRHLLACVSRDFDKSWRQINLFPYILTFGVL